MKEREPSHKIGVRVDLALCLAVASMLVLHVQLSCGMDDGFIRQGNRRLFPIGSYELPKEDDKLALMAEAGIMYFGSDYLQSQNFRQSLLALSSELAALQPFLIAPEAEDIEVRLIEIQWEPAGRGVKVSARQTGQDWLVVLVNEDDNRHMGVELSGLDFLNGKVMHLLYGQQDVTIQHGELVTRMQPYEVQVFCTSRKWESKQQESREFGKGNDGQ